MLSYALAIAIALSSLVLFSTAFVMSDIHRQDDFLWSGVGLLYALVLWFCARNITGAVLLGQAAASVLLISYNWQTLKLRKAIANPEKAAAINNFSVLKALNSLWQKNDNKPKVSSVTESESLPKVTESEIAIPETTSTEQNSNQTPSTTKKLKFGQKFWGKRKQKSAGITKNQLDEVLEEEKEEVTSANNPQNPEVANTSPSAKSESESQSESQPEAPAQSTEATKPESPDPETKSTEATKPESPTTDSSATNPSSQTDTPKPVTVAETPSSTPEEESPETPNPVNLDNTIERSRPTQVNTDTKDSETESNVEEKETAESSLDGLETVEVAEVLEATPEDKAKQRPEDSSNIIEVSTTEIEQVSEDKNSSQSPDSSN